MRLWSLHPKYLDTKGLVALWRETLLAKHVLQDKTKGYRNHPQLHRFKASEKPVDAIDQYLAEIYSEAITRGYNFDKTKINWNYTSIELTVTRDQLDYEVKHLMSKLLSRDGERYKKLQRYKKFDTHPLFRVIPGKIEKWEILADTAAHLI